MRTFHRQLQFDILEDRRLLSGVVVELPNPLSDNSGPHQVVLGPDGNYWYTESSGDHVGRITPAGQVTEFATKAFTGGIAVGPDGNIWFTEPSNGNSVTNYIGRITPAGTLTEFAIPTLGCDAQWITAGGDGNLYFTESTGGNVGRITTVGTITEFPEISGILPIPGLTNPEGITLGPDGNIWFTESGSDSIATFNPSNPANVTTYPDTATNSGPSAIVSGRNGSLWFTLVGANEIGQITTGGSVTLYPLPAGSETSFGQMCAGPDGNVWFPEYTKNIASITPAGTITEYSLPPASNGVTAAPAGMAAGMNGTVAFTDGYANRLGEVTTAKADSFINAVYGADLHRPAEPGGLAYWSTVLVNQGTAAVVQDVGRSQEAYTDVVDGFYRTFLKREADPSGQANFVSYLQRGGTPDGMLALILGSAEFYGDVTAGSSSPSASFVEALYSDLLHRTPSPNEVGGWVNALASASRTAVAAAFEHSAEFRTDAVESFYLSLLHRQTVSASEIAGWVHSGLDLYSIELDFEQSPEFFSKN